MNASAEKTEEQIAKDKAAVEAMKNAKSNMDGALSRISSLETALLSARAFIEAFKAYIPKNVYPYSSQKSLHDAMNDEIAAITKRLG